MRGGGTAGQHHPSMVGFEDGAVIAQLGTPDMKLPIQYALYYPERRFLPGTGWTFENYKDFLLRCRIWRRSGALSWPTRRDAGGGTLPTVFNAANEMAVAMFLERKINYLTIVDMIEGAMEHHCVKALPLTWRRFWRQNRNIRLYNIKMELRQKEAHAARKGGGAPDGQVRAG